MRDFCGQSSRSAEHPSIRLLVSLVQPLSQLYLISFLAFQQYCLLLLRVFSEVVSSLMVVRRLNQKAVSWSLPFAE